MSIVDQGKPWLHAEAPTFHLYDRMVDSTGRKKLQQRTLENLQQVINGEPTKHY